MRGIKYLFAAIIAAALFVLPAHKAEAQVTFGVNIGGPAPICPYGYYGYAPYNCAPYGYYGPEWFSNGIFVGAGPWWHGHGHFYGHVNRAFDPRYGYRGGFPARGGHYREPADHWHSFHGNNRADEHGGYHGHGR
ncbi:hypothetical protein GOB94_09615 [Granulicella sp. 5B5]|uniref:hypothetical protein n=1 Tax=Granulicella sp. 5B5 TaxID=1617967 RepID=UPI0015F47718|nr:hypothetical protein [Granulicella sp. 5B5]QMV18902.1 hypothetical protein GOB94_09615 [Granulicella sp. 5B5]